MLNSHIEKSYTYKGYHVLVILTSLGHRCGYVGPLTEELENEDVHGGWTYTGLMDDKGGKKGITYLGFDCSHYGDSPDIKALSKISTDTKMIEIVKRHFRQGDRIWTTSDVENHLKEIVDRVKPNSISFVMEE